MTTKLTKVSHMYLEPNQISMISFATIVNGFDNKKVPSWILDWGVNIHLSVLKSQENEDFCLLSHIHLSSSFLKCSPFYEK